MRLQYAPFVLDFKRPAGTSRGVMTRKLTCLLRLYDEAEPAKFGIGEAAIFEGLSPEGGQKFEIKLLELVANIALQKPTDLSEFSSIKYGLEQAIRDYSSGCQGIYYPSDFTLQKQSVEINGLIWMGNLDFMQQQIEEKIRNGFKCIKLKIGSLRWNDEVELIKKIRGKFTPEELCIRVDANGAFNMDNALPRLKRLADLGVHSIEQPIPSGNRELMKFLCQVSPLPIALDEELIGIGKLENKRDLLENINPAYIILKPALCGGFSGAEEWIKLSTERGIGWWITSALESNVGLNALSQFTATFNPSIPQGLGTGNLFTNNFTTPIFLNKDNLQYNCTKTLDYQQFTNLDWRG